jgi:hypothetical protein
MEVTGFGRLGGDIEAVDPGRPRVRLEQRGQDVHERGLAGPVRVEQREDAGGGHLEVHPAKQLQLLVRLHQTCTRIAGSELARAVIWTSVLSS